MAMFNSFLYVYQRVDVPLHQLIEYFPKKSSGLKKKKLHLQPLNWGASSRDFVASTFFFQHVLIREKSGHPIAHMTSQVVLSTTETAELFFLWLF